MILLVPALALGMIMAWCMPQKALLILLALMLMVLGIILIIKN